MYYQSVSDGNWASWSTWSGCTTTCGDEGMIERNRTCLAPVNEGAAICPTQGAASESIPCPAMAACPIGKVR